MATSIIEKFIEKVFGCNLQELNKHFVATRDRTVWYKVRKADNTMFVPDTNVIKVNQFELNNFIGAVQSFCTFDSTDTRFDWNEKNMVFHNYSGEAVETGFSKLLNYLEKLPNKHLVACDIESRYLEWDGNKLLSIGFATQDNECWAFWDIPEKFYKLLEFCLNVSQVYYVWHNGKFDCRTLYYTHKIRARIDEDSELKHFVQVSEAKGTHKLKSLGPIYLQAPNWDDELDAYKKEYCKKHKIKLADFTYDLIPIEILIPYMRLDCIATRRLIGVFEELKEPGTDFIYRQLIRAANVFIQIELSGAQADADHLKVLEKEFSSELEIADKLVETAVNVLWDPLEYSKETGAKYSPEFSLQSPKKLRWILTKAIGYDPGSTDADTITAINEQIANGTLQVSEAGLNLLESISKQRKASKYLDTYVFGMQKATCADGKIRGGYNLHGTETGRLSSSKPK